MRDMAETRRSLRGVHNFLPTPFLPDCRPDLDGMRDNVAYHARTGPEDMTVTVCGGFGEGLALDAEEHRDVVAAAVDGGAGRVPIAVVALGGYGMQRKMARNAQETGADSVRVRFPTFGDTSAEGAYTYLRGLAESVDIAVVVFVVGDCDFWPGVLERLAAVPNVVGFSPPGDAALSDRVGRAVQERVPGRFVWINENEQAAMKSFPQGCVGYTTAVASIVPGASRAFWQAGVAGDTERMAEVYEQLIEPIISLRGLGPGCEIGGIKAALELLGRAGGPTRPPVTQVSGPDRERIAQILRGHPEARHLVQAQPPS